MSIQRCVPLYYFVAIFPQFGYSLVEHPLNWWMHSHHPVVWHDADDQWVSGKLLVYILSPRHWW
jgi:hypothetical protein